MDKVLTVKEAAEALQVSADTIRRKIKSGDIKAEKLPGPYGVQWCIREDDLAESMQVVDVVPVRGSMTADDLEAMLRTVMQEQTAEIKGLRQEIQDLRQEIQEQKVLTTNDNTEKRWWQFWQR